MWCAAKSLSNTENINLNVLIIHISETLSKVQENASHSLQVFGELQGWDLVHSPVIRYLWLNLLFLSHNFLGNNVAQVLLLGWDHWGMRSPVLSVWFTAWSWVLSRCFTATLDDWPPENNDTNYIQQHISHVDTHV